MSDIHTWREIAIRAAEASGEVVRRFYRTAIEIERKPDGSRVTAADRATETCIRDILEREVPDHGIVGEELGEVRPNARWRWVIDPIDGTDSFVAGGFDFGTLIALLEDGEPILGVIHQPVLRQLVIGDGTTTECNGTRVRVRTCPRLEDAVLLTTDIVRVGNYRDARGFDAVGRRVALCRTWGNCYGYAQLATGFADAMVDPILAPWDILALIPVVRGAGGVITGWDGGDPRTADSLVAAVPELHTQLVDALAGR